MNLKVFLSGFMGSGKSFWGKIWAKEHALTFFDLDEEIEKVTGDIVHDIFERNGEEYFREKERHTLREFASADNFIIACGGGTPCFFDNLQWMNEQGITIYLKASANEILKRIENETHKRPLLSKVGEEELLYFIEQKLKEREPFYEQAKHILNVGALTSASLSEIIFDELKIKN